MKLVGPTGDSVELTIPEYVSGAEERLVLSIRSQDQGQLGHTVDLWLSDVETLRLADWLQEIGRTEAIPMAVRFRESGLSFRLLFSDGKEVRLRVGCRLQASEAPLFVEVEASLVELAACAESLHAEMAKHPPG